MYIAFIFVHKKNHSVQTWYTYHIQIHLEI